MNRLTIRARSIARRTGLKRLYYKFVHPTGYEQKLRAAMLKHIKAGDVVWDVGANCGHYTTLFCDQVGPEGRVFAFEPAPYTFAELCRNTEQYPWTRNEQIALGDFDGTGRMIVNEAYHRSSHLQRNVSEASMEGAVDVPVLRGDSYWTASGISPNVIKIDVEGFEEEVVNGMAELLSAPDLRAVFIEVHMQALEERGRAVAPLRIEKLLRGKGLKPSWIDASHICADRLSV